MWQTKLAALLKHKLRPSQVTRNMHVDRTFWSVRLCFSSFITYASNILCARWTWEISVSWVYIPWESPFCSSLPIPRCKEEESLNLEQKKFLHVLPSPFLLITYSWEKFIIFTSIIKIKVLWVVWRHGNHGSLKSKSY